MENLLEIAKELSVRYSSSQAYRRALLPRTRFQLPMAAENWRFDAPEGSPWTGTLPVAVIEEDRAILDKGTGSVSSTGSDVAPAKKSELPRPTPQKHLGDIVLANSICFMRDAILQREASFAVSAGDMGRVFEVFTVSPNQDGSMMVS